MAVEKNTVELTAFEQHLEVHGARAERWPAQARERFESLLLKDERARALLTEAQALERLLDLAPLPDTSRIEALGDRIAALAADSGDAHASAPVIEIATRRRPRPLMQAVRWKVASALAASLLVGFYIGASPPVVTAIEAIAGAVGLPAGIESSDLVLLYDGTDEEDFL